MVENGPDSVERGQDEPEDSTEDRGVRPTYQAPTLIGPYHVRSVIGTGGMGTVYLAEQTEPIRRRVALKVIKPGMDSEAVVARFEVEEQALALMDHPNVAKVFDVGMTEHGRPYFAMEYVPGVPITEHCDRYRFGIEERLVMFAQVCDAIQHAHQKGIIHRDIKPSNILVAFQDEKPVPKVIDFGVAKAIGQPLTAKTAFTVQGQLIGTPSYMSPEQAEMAAQNIDTRSDIYSLGVLLYELLTGALPFDPESLRQVAFDEIRRIIREVDPPKPSTKLSGLTSTDRDDSASVARSRRVNPRTLTRQLRGDLDWITMKALEKDRARRYASASDFAGDVRRHLTHEPVVASPPSAAYRVKKFVRRNRTVVMGVGAVLAALAIGVVVSTWLAIRATGAEALAEQRLVQAQDEAAKARAVVDFLQTMLVAPDPHEEGRDVLVLDVLEKAARDLDAGAVGRPEVEAAARTAIGQTYLGLARFDEAEEQLRTAVRIRTQVLGGDHPDVAESLFHLAWLLKERGELAAAAAMYRRCLVIQRGGLGDENELVANTKHDLGVVFQEMGELDQAHSLLHESMTLTQRLKGPCDRGLARTMTDLARLDAMRGDYATAETLQRDALSIFRTCGGTRADVALALSNLASLLRETGRLDDAAPLARAAYETRCSEYGAESPAAAASLVERAQISGEMGDYGTAEAMLREALTIYRRTYGESHAHVATTLLVLARVIDDKGDSEAATALFLEAINIYGRAHGPGHWMTANARSLYGVCLMRLKRYEESGDQLIGAHTILSSAGLADHARLAAERLSDLYTAWGKEAEAERWRSLASEDPPPDGE